MFQGPSVSWHGFVWVKVSLKLGSAVPAYWVLQLSNGRALHGCPRVGRTGSSQGVWGVAAAGEGGGEERPSGRLALPWRTPFPSRFHLGGCWPGQGPLGTPPSDAKRKEGTQLEGL